jgi:hypothetical protein
VAHRIPAPMRAALLAEIARWLDDRARGG